MDPQSRHGHIGLRDRQRAAKEERKRKEERIQLQKQKYEEEKEREMESQQTAPRIIPGEESGEIVQQEDEEDAE